MLQVPAAQTMLYEDSSEFGLRELEMIIQSLVWVTDRIIIPASLRPHQSLSKPDVDRVYNMLGELLELGLLEMWDFDPAIGVRLHSTPAWLPTPTRRIRTVNRDVYNDLYEAVEQGTADYRQIILRGRGIPSKLRLEGVSEFVSLRSGIWALGLADFFGAKQLLISPERSRVFSEHFSKTMAVSKIRGPAIQSLMELRNIRSLLDLSTDDIKYLRKYNIRAFLLDMIEASIPQNRLLQTDDVIERAKGMVIKEYVQNLNAEATKSRNISKSVQTIGADWVVNILGIIYPLLQGLSFAKPVLSWGLNRMQGRGLVFFMAELEKRTQKKQSSPSS